MIVSSRVFRLALVSTAVLNFVVNVSPAFSMDLPFSNDEGDNQSTNVPRRVFRVAVNAINLAKELSLKDDGLVSCSRSSSSAENEPLPMKEFETRDGPKLLPDLSKVSREKLEKALPLALQELSQKRTKFAVKLADFYYYHLERDEENDSNTYVEYADFFYPGCSNTEDATFAENLYRAAATLGNKKAIGGLARTLVHKDIDTAEKLGMLAVSKGIEDGLHALRQVYKIKYSSTKKPIYKRLYEYFENYTFKLEDKYQFFDIVDPKKEKIATKKCKQDIQLEARFAIFPILRGAGLCPDSKIKNIQF